MIIDAHAHVIVPQLLREAAPEQAWRPAVRWEGDKQIIDFAGKQLKSALLEFVEIDQIVANQQAAGVDCVLLCPWVSLVRYNAEPEEGLHVSRAHNQGIAQMAAEYPGRVIGLGSVPLQDPQLAARELESVMQTPGLCGVQIAASVNGVYLGDERFRPFWQAAEALGAFVFIHPTTRGFALDVFDDYYLWNTVGNPMETTITAAHMIFSGVMSDYPKLKLMLAHGGGTLMSLRGRLRHAAGFQPQARARLEEPFDDALRCFYFDTVTHDPTVLRDLIDYAGAEHVLLGSDYPFDMGDLRPAEIVRSLGLPAAEEALILGGNAKRLLGMEV